MGNLKFNGKSTEELGLVIQTPPSYTFPEKDISSVHIPGRNGDLYIDNKCYKNVDRTYALAKGFRPGTKLYPNAQEILAWLTSADGKYVRLEDNYDSEVYRMAMFNMGSSFVNYFDEATSIDITFQCKPQRFLKSGDNEIKFDKSTVIIENPTGYVAQPLIKITGILVEDDDMVMLTVSDYTGEAVSSVTLKDINNVVLDSEGQTIEDINGKNISSNVSLNGLIFPEFRKSKSIIEISRFIRKDSGYDAIKSYESLISEHRLQCDCLYKPIDVVETEKQTKFFAKPWEQVISEKQKGLYAEAYQSYMGSKAEEFTILSPSKILDETGIISDKISGKLSDYPGAIHDTSNGYWKIEYSNAEGIKYLEIRQSDSTEKYSAYCYISGYYILYNDNDMKKMKHITGASASNPIELFTNRDKSKVTEIIYYKQKNDGTLFIDYDSINIPSWITYIVENDGDGSPSIVKIVSTSTGYYKLPKKWAYYNSQTQTILATYKWASGKFVSTEGIFKKEKDYTYKYIASLLDYIPDKERNEELHFNIDSTNTSSDLSNISIKTIEAGYYKVLIDGDSTASWEYYSANTRINIAGGISGTKSFSVFYIPSISDSNSEPDVNYSQLKEGWPEWLYNLPVKTDGSDYNGKALLNANSINFKVLKTKYYKYYDPENEKWIEESWSPKSSGDVLQTNIAKDKSLYICKIDEPPTEWPDNRVYVIYTKDPVTGELIIEESDTPPSWLEVDIDTIPSDPENPDSRKIHYSDPSDVSGYWKWDTNTVWIQKDIGTIDRGFLNTSIKDNATFFYMEILPEYEAIDFPDYDPTTQTSLFFDLVKLEHKEIDGNPSEVIITIKPDKKGYYRINNNANWKYYNSGSELAVSKVGETNKIYYLEPNTEGFDDIEITIIPRWWML